MFSSNLLLSTLACMMASMASTVAAVEEEIVTSTAKKYSQHTMFELAQLTLWQRLKLYPWTVELTSGGFILFYVLCFFYGSKTNEKYVTKFINSNIDLLKEQFYQVGVTPSQLFAKDDQDHFAFYASGRLYIESLTAKFQLQPRSNFFIWSMEFVMSFFFDSIKSPRDHLTLEFKFDKDASAKFDDFIWAVVTKDKMNDFRTDNYFLSLTKTSESSNLPTEFVYMNEVPEMNELLHHKKLNKILESNKKLLKFIAITDLSSEKPAKESEFLQTGKKIIVELSIPKTQADIESSKELIDFLLNEYIDFVVTKASFRSELTKKCKKTREAELLKLKKVEDELKKELLATKKIEEQKLLKEKLTPEEQRKLEKKQKERRDRRQLNKQKVRG